MKRCTIHYLLGFALFSTIFTYALDSQGNVSVAGFVETDLNDLRDTLFSVTQYNASGMVNTNFGDSGLATLPFRHGVAMDVTIDQENRVVVVGTAIDPAVGLPRALIARFDSDGNLDTSFNMGGLANDGGPGFVWLQPGPSVANSVVPRDTVYNVCGSRITTQRYEGFVQEVMKSGATTLPPALISDAKLNSTTTLVTVGKKITHGIPYPLLVAANTTEVIAPLTGEYLDLDLIRIEDETVTFFVAGKHANKGLLASYDVNPITPSATPNTSFGSQGFVIAEFGNKQTIFNAVKVDNSADPVRIFVCGTARSLQSRMFVAEYDTSGNLVPTFGDNGVMTLFEGPNVQTRAVDLVLPVTFQNDDPQLFSCPSGSSTGMFAVGAANGRTPLVANLSCSGGSLKTEYGDQAIASLATEELTSMTVVKEVEPTGDSLPIPGSSPFAREFNALFGNPFAVSLTGSGTDAGFVLQPGRYYLDAQAPIQDAASHQLALYNDVLGINEAVGDSVWNSSGILTKALLKGQLFVSEPTKYILRHYFSGAGPDFAIGQAANLPGLDEVYAQMNIQQL